MKLIEIIAQYTELKKVSSTEWAGPCPGCGGKDRFRFWPEQDRYWCRQCEKKGDAIQFCREYLNMSYQEACIAVDKSQMIKNLPSVPKRTAAPRQEPEINRQTWNSQAQIFAEWAHRQLLKRPELVQWLESERQLMPCQVKQHLLGFNPKPLYTAPEKWGMTGKQVFIPQGLVIPYLNNAGTIYGLNIRQFKTSDNLPGQYMPSEPPSPPYLRVRGTESRPLILGDLSRAWPVVIVESELDALVLWRDLDCMVNVVAILSASIVPELPTSGPVLYALDTDNAGRAKFKEWFERYNARPAPPVRGKDITDMARAGVSLTDWLKVVLKKNGLLTPQYLNPYAHYTLLTGQNWDVTENLSPEFKRLAPDIVAKWQQAYTLDVNEENTAAQEYKEIWGLI